MTKADILNDFDEIKACIGYNIIEGNESWQSYDFKLSTYNNTTTPIYKSFKGWNTSTNKEPLEEYIKYIESEVGVKVSIVSFGRDRNNLYLRD